MSDRTIELVEPSPEWRIKFEREKEKLEAVLGKNCVQVHHIGSTAIKGILAKPIIDILVEAHNLAQIDEKNEEMKGIGYEAKGEHGIAGRRYFQKEEGGSRAFHVHIFLQDDQQVQRHLAFRNGMNGDESLARAYEKVKLNAMQRAESKSGKYQELKGDFIEAMTQKFLMEGWANRP